MSDLDEKGLPPVMVSLGGFPYNGEHIEHWRERALKAEAAIRAYKAAEWVGAVAVKPEMWGADEVEIATSSAYHEGYEAGRKSALSAQREGTVTTPGWTRRFGPLPASPLVVQPVAVEHRVFEESGNMERHSPPKKEG